MTQSFVYLAIMIVAGFLGSALARKLKFPAVTGYLVAGLVIGIIGFIPKETLYSFNTIADLALGFIAFSIGSEFKLSFLRKIGLGPIVITVFETMGAVIVLNLLLRLVGLPLPVALVLSAIGAATAPAATLMVIKQYKADGPVTRTLLPVVAMDDAMTLLIFSVSATAAQIIAMTQDVSVAPMLLHPLKEVGGSLIVGGAIGGLAAIFLGRFKRDGDRLGLALLVVFASVGLATGVGLSALLTAMTAGAVFTNVSKQSVKMIKVTEAATPPLFMLFFVISGAELDIRVLTQIGLVGIVYVVGRVIGKVLGCYLGARISKAEPVVRKHLGFTLIPQAGVAIGLSLVALRTFPEYGEMIRAVVLCATLIYELTGPLITKATLKHAGEIKEEEGCASKNTPPQKTKTDMV